MRALLYSRKDRCLWDCLLLRRYLEACGLSCELWFGVKVEPFRAHCWLQWGDVAIDDDPGIVGTYTPIMVA
jgi:hypothetical protein